MGTYSRKPPWSHKHLPAIGFTFPWETPSLAHSPVLHHMSHAHTHILYMPIPALSRSTSASNALLSPHHLASTKGREAAGERSFVTATPLSSVPLLPQNMEPFFQLSFSLPSAPHPPTSERSAKRGSYFRVFAPLREATPGQPGPLSVVKLVLFPATAYLQLPHHRHALRSAGP